MIVMKEMDILKAKAEFDDIMAMVQVAAQEGTRIDLVEQDLWHRLLRLGRITLGSLESRLNYQLFEIAVLISRISRFRFRFAVNASSTYLHRAETAAPEILPNA